MNTLNYLGIEGLIVYLMIYQLDKKNELHWYLPIELILSFDTWLTQRNSAPLFLGSPVGYFKVSFNWNIDDTIVFKYFFFDKFLTIFLVRQDLWTSSSISPFYIIHIQNSDQFVSIPWRRVMSCSGFWSVWHIL